MGREGQGELMSLATGSLCHLGHVLKPPGPQFPINKRNRLDWMSPRVIKDPVSSGPTPFALPSTPRSPCQPKRLEEALPRWARGPPGAWQGLTLAGALIGEQLVALPAAALEAAHGVAAEVVAASVVDQALVDVCGSQGGWRSESQENQLA